MARSKSKKNKREILLEKNEQKNDEISIKNEEKDVFDEKKLEKIEKNTSKNDTKNQKQYIVKQITRLGYILAPISNPENLRTVSRSIGKYQVGDIVEY